MTRVYPAHYYGIINKKIYLLYLKRFFTSKKNPVLEFKLAIIEKFPSDDIEKTLTVDLSDTKLRTFFNESIDESTVRPKIIWSYKTNKTYSQVESLINILVQEQLKKYI